MVPTNTLFSAALHAIRDYFGVPVQREKAQPRDAATDIVDAQGFTVYQRSFPETEWIAHPNAKEGEEPLPPTNQMNYDSLVDGFKVKVKLFSRPFQDYEDALAEEEIPLDGSPNTALSAFFQKASVCFVDPSWGINKDGSKYGGIDLPAELWGRYR